MPVQAIDAQGASAERQRHLSTYFLMAHPSSSPAFIFHDIHGHRKGERVCIEFGEGVHVSCRHRICHASTYRFWNEAMGGWRGTDGCEYTPSRAFYSRRSSQKRLCQTSSRPEHVRRSPTQTSTSRPDIDRGRARSARRRSRDARDDDLVCRRAPAHIPPPKP